MVMVNSVVIRMLPFSLEDFDFIVVLLSGNCIAEKRIRENSGAVDWANVWHVRETGRECDAAGDTRSQVLWGYGEALNVAGDGQLCPVDLADEIAA